MNEENRDLLLEEQKNLLELLSKLNPGDKEYLETVRAIDELDKILEREITNKRVDKLEARVEEVNTKASEGSLWYNDPYFWLKVGEFGFKGWMFLTAMNWESENNWTSKVYDKIRNIF